MTLEEMLKLKPGDRVVVNFKLSGGRIMPKKCTIRHIIKPKERNPFAFVAIDNNIIGNMFPAKPEQITKLEDE